ncbi:MAG TPA: DUF3667 domain-containing protein [Vicinamibacterales bacterium]|nr:DUF3667 domain-containing protein [Vicinamibacterales bacterium]
MIEALTNSPAGHCLNCNAALNGTFCAACGQRAVRADPTVSELAGDAWHELSGYDGRIAATFRALLHPGKLTLEYLQGRRARYLSPVRLYLTVSVIYFLVAAAAPQVAARTAGDVTGPGALRIGVTGTRNGTAIVTEADRAEMQKQLVDANWLIRPLLKSLLEDPDGFRARMFTIMPRVFFAMLPVFAAIVALFYRHRRFPAVLVYALHIHAFAFLIFTVGETAKFSGSEIVAAVVGLIAFVAFAVYTHRSLQVVFGGGQLETFAKETGIGFAYALVSVPAFVIILIWASMV